MRRNFFHILLICLIITICGGAITTRTLAARTNTSTARATTSANTTKTERVTGEALDALWDKAIEIASMSDTELAQYALSHEGKILTVVINNPSTGDRRAYGYGADSIYGPADETFVDGAISKTWGSGSDGYFVGIYETQISIPYPAGIPYGMPPPGWIPPHEHSGGTATCKELAICSYCNQPYGSYAAHSYTNTCSKAHCSSKICKWCEAHETACGGDHVISSTWTGDSNYHWKGCTVPGCTHKYSQGSHTGGTATCIKGKVCTVCNREYGTPLGHIGGTATCNTLAKCIRCGTSYGSYASHSYTSTCSKIHCKKPICCWCGVHKDTCGGGHNTNGYCNHCLTSYCTLCMPGGHTCTHNSSGKCTNVHCVGMTWCTNCERVNGINSVHTHRTCSYFSSSFTTCALKHCTAKICPKCGEHQSPCGGDHVYAWQGNQAKSNPSEIHQKKCTVAGCNAIEQSHTPIWGVANSSHTATCTQCSYYTYTHTADYTDKNNPHKCVGNNGKCEATHAPAWSTYYKITENEHTRKCTFENCVVIDTPHQFVDNSDNPWNWDTADVHIKTCQHAGCGLTTTQSHSFKTGNAGYDVKAQDASYSELYKHWLVCKTCDSTVPAGLKPHGNVDEEHTDDGTGKCSKCGQILWKMVKIEGNAEEDITDYVLGKNANKLPARNQQKIKIIEVKTGNAQYVQSIFDENSNTILADNGVITITKNGTYGFYTCRGGVAYFSIDHISDGVIIDRIIDPVTSTKDKVTITLRSSESEKEFNKKIYIKEGNSISDLELDNGSNPFSLSEDVYKNGIYTFIAKDTAGNEQTIEIVIDNIVKGQATVAVSNDVFINGYAFTEILINPSENWEINKENIVSVIKASVCKTGSTTPTALNDTKNIRLVKVMDRQRNDITSLGPTYAPGEYYLQIAIGGNIFNQKATYIVDLESVELNLKTLDGQNRIIVEVQDLKDLT